MRLILACPVDPARQSLLVEFVETYLPLAGREQMEFHQIVHSDHKYVEVEQMITVYEKKGIEKGIEKGLQQGRQNALILLLEKKFGKLSATMKRKVREIESTEKLESLLLAILDANSLADLPF